MLNGVNTGLISLSYEAGGITRRSPTLKAKRAKTTTLRTTSLIEVW